MLVIVHQTQSLSYRQLCLAVLDQGSLQVAVQNSIKRFNDWHYGILWDPPAMLELDAVSVEGQK